jgi:two-component system LytT family response regulator
MTIKCWIIDDEPAAHKGIMLALEKHSDFQVVYHGYSVEQVSLEPLVKPDVIFLDIEMPNQSGFELLTLWPELLPNIVFITAYNQYAVTAFNNNALDYLLKPIEQARFDDMTNKVRQRIKEQEVMLKRSSVEDFYNQIKQRESQLELSIKTSDGLYRIKQKDIIYIESVSSHLAFHYGDKTLLARDAFKRLSLELDPKFFFRTHKSYIANLAHVTKVAKGRFGDALLEMSNSHQIKMSRRYNDILQQLEKN